MPPQAKVYTLISRPTARAWPSCRRRTAPSSCGSPTAPGAAKAVVSGADRINATTGNPCDWLRDNVTMVCALVPAGRGPAPAEPAVPPGRTSHENYGKAAPAPTYEDLLNSAHDDALFDYYFTSQLAAINTGNRREDANRQARGIRQRDAGARRPAPAHHEDQEAVLAHGADERLPAGRRDLVARRRAREEDRRPAVARRHHAHRRRAGTAQLPLARRPAGDGRSGSRRSTAAI